MIKNDRYDFERLKKYRREYVWSEKKKYNRIAAKTIFYSEIKTK